MGYVLDPDRNVEGEVRRVAAERLGDAIDRLAAVAADGGADLETTVHEVRKRCKSTRGLARLVRHALGDSFTPFDHLVRDAANELSSLRDAHAVLGAIDALARSGDDLSVRAVRDRHAAIARASGTAVDVDERIATARTLLGDALAASQRWEIPEGFDALEPGLVATYRRGRSGLRRATTRATDERLHEWRKAVKYLWYQMQLLHDAAPSVLGPAGDELDQLAETLGDDHDLAVLVQLLDEHPDDYGTPDEIADVQRLARQRQHELRQRAFRSGATIYAEPDHAFVQRIAGYWRLSVDLGPEPGDGAPPAPRGHIERERKFLVTAIPDDVDLTAAVALRQGYLAVGEQRSIRIRDAGPEGCTLTFKATLDAAGVAVSGAERTELEWPIDRREFDTAWPHTEGQRIEKVRHRIPARDVHGGYVIELDVFGGPLAGLVIAEVEFGSGAALAAFTPPEWFGTEVTDDGRYTNAALALHGRP